MPPRPPVLLPAHRPSARGHAAVAPLAKMVAVGGGCGRAGGWGLLPGPVVETMLNTVSTDDAYVNGHVTFVAPRVAGQVIKVLVDDNYRVKKGDLLVQLDKEPYQVQVAIKQAAVADGGSGPGGGRGPGARPGGPGSGQSLQARARHRGRRYPDRHPAGQRGDAREQEGDSGPGAGRPQTRRGAGAQRGHQQGRTRPAPANGQGRRSGRRPGPADGLRRSGSASACPPSRRRART